MTTLSPRWATVLSRELLKKKDYVEPESIPEKAKEALNRALRDEVPLALAQLKGVIRSPVS
jgi:hypothetical protein